ncbi:sporozoite invasion-associated protein 1, putative [Plasmodium chabaudi chabaudi]|uniref:Sporozoite invasion-associated protein 1, putative n=1 Tax=Plasmodium chabaudi chabaudi TaxID=31271 RepID=A0A077YHE2_PLACU|nr:sporozoite invasion-associated protein 1, putative [Plasmodium chabaudi chabaudi]SCM01869.1 sporozoite invasion-associated protein 1, putative [Plasmodium chabaudi chabaudi]VTZ66407.1 sporozoite invasion-associated protein 1, putative [Plasmodium chabaudi chabaudi]|eukprot:XP_743821.2 sporozoite invasion-associated protein 1, putative [Plasmodium chabaudi chabaudi]
MKGTPMLILLFLIGLLGITQSYNIRHNESGDMLKQKYKNYRKGSNSINSNNSSTNEEKFSFDFIDNGFYGQYHPMNFMESSAFLDNMMHDKEDATYSNSRSYKITGTVKGIIDGYPVAVALGAQYSNNFDYLQIEKLTINNPHFTFNAKRGQYYIRIYGASYMTPSSIKISVPCNKCKYMNSSYSDEITITPYESDPSTFIYEWELQSSSPIPMEHINTIHNDDADWSHDHDLSNEIKLDGSGSSALLKTFYGIELFGFWGSEFSDRLLQILSRFPDCIKIDPYESNPQNVQRKPQKWILSPGDLGAFDMNVEVYDNGDNNAYSKMVRVASNAFGYSKKVVQTSEKNGRFFSRRLEKVIIRAILADNYNLFTRYFEEKHGVMLLDPIADMHIIESVTGYSYDNYQAWYQNVEEIVELATSWDELPQGFQKVPGLKYLSRRKNGTTHPVYPTAPAVAFPAGPNANGLLEFMELAFVNYRDISHLVIHEIGHFIYTNTLSDELKESWINLGQWYSEPLSPSLWATRDETSFVSAYAHDKTPSEDFSESIASFVLNSKLLNSRSNSKYEWIKKNLFNGGFYLTTGTHKFEVINLGNDVFYYPGKVKKLHVEVLGNSAETKLVKIDINLMSIRGQNVGCAKYAYARFFSEQGTYRDVHFFAKPGDDNVARDCTHHLYTEFSVNATESKGKWVAESISFTGENNIERYAGLGSFLCYAYINNENEDVESPIPLLNSARIYPYDGQNGEDSLLRLNILVLDNSMLSIHGGTYASFASYDNESYSFGKYTVMAYDPEYDVSKLNNDYFVNNIYTSGFRQVDINACSAYTTMDLTNLKCYQVINPVPIPQYCIGSRYYFRQFSVEDEGRNKKILNVSTNDFFGDLKQSGIRDSKGPVVNNVNIQSRQANPHHDGETEVTLDFHIYDELAGVYNAHVFLRDPHGGVHYFEVPRTLLPRGGEARDVRHVIILPKGSMAGTWILDKIKTSDICKNETTNTYSYSVFVDNS